MSYKAGRFQRRLAERRAKQAREESGEVKVAPPPVFEDRRNEDRRAATMSPKEVEDWLRRNGIAGGDRRKGDRRRR